MRRDEAQFRRSKQTPSIAGCARAKDWQAKSYSEQPVTPLVKARVGLWLKFFEGGATSERRRKRIRLRARRKGCVEPSAAKSTATVAQIHLLACLSTAARRRRRALAPFLLWDAAPASEHPSPRQCRRRRGPLARLLRDRMFSLRAPNDLRAHGLRLARNARTARDEAVHGQTGGATAALPSSGSRSGARHQLYVARPGVV